MVIVVVVSVVWWVDAVWGLIVVGGGWLIVGVGGMGRGRGVTGKVKEGVWSGIVGCTWAGGGGVVGRG